MSFLHVHPDDARWLRRWLRSNLLCFAAIICFALAIRADPFALLDAMTQVQAEPGKVTVVEPQGWRRTSQGWEHASSWRQPQPLGEIIRDQQAREPVWLQFTLAKLRDVPPLMFALIQITAIAVIVNLAKNNQVQQRPAREL